MTSINNQEDFLRALRDNPEWREAVRAHILGEDLLKLPGKFDAFREDMTTFMERTDRRLGLLEDGQKALQDGQQSIRRDLAPIKGFHAQNAAARESRDIARAANCRQTALMDRDWLELLVDHGDAPGVSPGDLASFQKAGMVILARSRENGQTVYLPVEASFTARSHDFDRAARNARLLGQFTNETAIPVVASHTLSSPVFPIWLKQVMR